MIIYVRTKVGNRVEEKDRFVRGSIKSLGREYTKERIKEWIELKRERNSYRL